jgi:transposase-like protein
VPRSSPFAIELSPAERADLESRSHRYSAPYRDVVRARIVLLAAEGAENTAIARRLELPVQVVSKWRKRFFRGAPGRPGGAPPHRPSADFSPQSWSWP